MFDRKFAICALSLFLISSGGHAADCLSESLTQQAGIGIKELIKPTALTAEQYRLVENFLRDLGGYWRGSGRRIDCGAVEGVAKAESEYSITAEATLSSIDRGTQHLAFATELEDRQTRTLTAQPYDFYLLTDAEMRDGKRSRTLRLADTGTDGDLEILTLVAGKIVFTQKFERRLSKEPHELVRTLKLSDRALQVEELHYVEGRLAVIREWDLKRRGSK